MTYKMWQPWKIIGAIGLVLMLAVVANADQYKVVRVYDGDTVTAEGQGTKIKIRLVGIDAPETGKRKNDPGQPYSQASKKYLAQLVLNKTITVVNYGLDRYGRVLGEITVAGTNANVAMVYYGLAEVYRGRPPKGLSLDQYRLAEIQAQQALRGIWAQGDQYVSPKVFRNKQRK